MNTMARFLLLVVALNVVRYLVGGLIEAATIMEPMHRVLSEYPEVFTEFTANDYVISFFYNFMLWLTATWVFHLLHPVLKGPIILRSLKSFGLMALFFISLAAVYMNHYSDAIKPFYLYSMLDALIVFSIIGLANGLLYPLFFRRSLEEQADSGLDV